MAQRFALQIRRYLANSDDAEEAVGGD